MLVAVDGVASSWLCVILVIHSIGVVAVGAVVAVVALVVVVGVVVVSVVVGIVAEVFVGVGLSLAFLAVGGVEESFFGLFRVSSVFRALGMVLPVALRRFQGS